MKKIGILFQIANLKVWNKMKDLIDNFNNDFILMTHFNQDLLTENEIEQIVMYYKKKNINCIITKFKNKGMDIGGFFKQIEYIINNNLKFDYILKIHTKSNDQWRSHLVDPICSSKNIVDKCINLFQDPNVGLICCNRWYRKMDHFNTPIIINELKKFNIKNEFIDEIDWQKKIDNIYDLDYFDPDFYLDYEYNKIPILDDMKYDKDKLKSYAIFHWLQIGYNKFRFVQNKNLVIKKNKHISFCAGSIFWIRAEPLISFFKKYINFSFYYDNFEKGYFKNDNPTLTHSWERIFSIIIEKYQKKTIVL